MSKKPLEYISGRSVPIDSPLQALSAMTDFAYAAIDHAVPYMTVFVHTNSIMWTPYKLKPSFPGWLWSGMPATLANGLNAAEFNRIYNRIGQRNSPPPVQRRLFE